MTVEGRRKIGQLLEGKGEISGFISRLGTLGWKSGSWVFSLCLPLSNCGNEDKSLHLEDRSFFNCKMKLFPLLSTA